jgi:membrane protease YdiL (CAAX protease family)
VFAEPPPPRLIEPVASPVARVWRGIDALFGVFGLIGSLLLIYVLLFATFAAFEPGPAGEDAVGAAFTIGFEALFAATVLVLATRRRASLSDLGFRRPDRWGPLAIAVVGAYATLFGYGLLIGLLDQLGVDVGWFEGGNSIPLDEEASDGLPRVALIALFGVAVVLVAPIAEELFFRGLLFRSLDEAWPGWAAVVVSGVAFGAFHLNPAVILPFSVIGMLFAWAFRASGSLWVTVAAHFIINALSFIVTIVEVAR